MPLEWLSNYEQFHQNSKPIQTSEAIFERRSNGQVKMSFQTPRQSSDLEAPRLSYSAMIKAVTSLMGCSRSPYVQSWLPLPWRSIWRWWRLWNHEETTKEKKETFLSNDSLQILSSWTTKWSKLKPAFTNLQKGPQVDRKRRKTHSFSTKDQVMPNVLFL